MSFANDSDWLRDDLSKDQIILHKIKTRVASAQTAFQEVELLQTAKHGMTLVLDGTIQSAEADEWIYHESLVHPALLSCPAAGRVAILGGGEGATLREVLRHGWVSEAVMVDIDGEVVEFCRQNLQSFHQGAFDDPRAQILIDDARSWLEQLPDESFSSVIFDLSEPIEEGPSQNLFTREFFLEIKRVLVPEGTLGMHAGPVDLSQSNLGEFFPRLMATVGAVFEQVLPMCAHVFSFSDLWTFAVAKKSSEQGAILGDVDSLVKERVNGELRHYDAQCHAHMSQLPKYLRKLLKGDRRIFTDQHPPSLS